jgi:DNA-binding response OmpR family regulator
MDSKNGFKKVLVVDDEPGILKFISIGLKSFGYQVITSLNGQEALKLVETENPDIMLLDVLMPGMNGTEVLKTLRGFSQLPVIVFSAKSAFGDQVCQLGANDFVAKPFTPEILVKKIRSVLETVHN